jgi:hypothetical protein
MIEFDPNRIWLRDIWRLAGIQPAHAIDQD